MNGMILQTAAEGKDIQLPGKKGLDTSSTEDESLFGELIEAMILEEGESKNSQFLLGKLLNLKSSFEKEGQILSDFSKGDILGKLKKDLSEGESEEVLLKDLFQIALNFKQDQPIDTIPLSKELKAILGDKSVVAEFKNASNIKELLDVAKKHDIKVKNFQFFMPEKALDSKDQKLVQKITSEEIFKRVDSKELSTKSSPTISLLKQIIKKEDPSKTERTPLASLLKKEIKKEVKSEKTTLEKVLGDKTETKIEPFVEQLAKKAPQNKIATLLKNTQTNIQSTLEKNPIENKTEETLLSTEKSENKEVSGEKVNISHDIKSEVTHKNKEPIDIKKTFNTFATEFKEKVEAYKPPLMKINMQLSPANLGDVDVTLVTRGNNLQVNITSNTNSIALFMQNQNEFKTSLVNMGFSDLQMNFGDKRGEERSQQQHKEDKEAEGDYHDSLEEEIESISITLPNYV